MSLDLYNKNRSKKLKLFDTGAHAQSFNENMDEYEDLIHDFLDNFIYQKSIGILLLRMSFHSILGQ